VRVKDPWQDVGSFSLLTTGFTLDTPVEAPTPAREAGGTTPIAAMAAGHPKTAVAPSVIAAGGSAGTFRVQHR
jgi:hypothetical protein